MPLNRNHDVIGFQIAVYDPGGMSLYQALSHLLQISQQLSQFSSLPMDLFAQGEAVDKLHRDEVHAIVLADLINVSDVRMIERGGGLSLLRESPHAILIGRKVGR